MNPGDAIDEADRRLAARRAAPQSTDDLRFLDRFTEVEHTKNRLPHWQQPGAAFFVTFHLGDSLPEEKLGQWRAEREAWMKWNPSPWSDLQRREYDERFTAAIEGWLDEGAGECHLRQPDVRGVVAGTLSHHDGIRQWNLSWVIMPNHGHALFARCGDWKLEPVLHSWKGFSAREANRILGRRGGCWQKDYHDRMIRDSRHFWRCARCIRRNPEKAKLRPDEFTLFEAPWVKEKLDTEWSGGLPAADNPSQTNETGQLVSRPSDSIPVAGKPPLRA
jgi:hypothetical protein